MFDQSMLVQHHLSAHCYPPVGAAFVPLATRAIAAVVDGDNDVLLRAPGNTKITAGDVIETFRLHAFVTDEMR